MVQILPRRPSFGEQFSQAFQPAFQGGLERFLGEEQLKEREQRKMKSDEIAEQRKIEAQKATARALGLPEAAMEPSVQAALLKEREKDKRNQQLLEALGIGQPKGRGLLEDETEPSDISGMGRTGAFQPGEFSDEQIAGLGLINPQLASTLQRQKESQQKSIRDKEKEERRQFEAERGYHTDLTKETRKKISGLRDSLPKKEAALNQARNALETEDLGFFSRDKLADLTGINAFRTAKGAQLITAGKENLLSNMSRVSSKAQNQWFEQRLNSMFPQIGNTKEANLTIQEMLDGEVALDKAYLEDFDRLAAEDREKYGFIREDIEERAQKASQPKEKAILDRTSYRLRQIYEQEKGPQFLMKSIDKKVPRGTPLTVEMAQILIDKYGEKAEKKAQELGYTLPSEEIYMEFVS